jgi:hypothetical protein
LVSEFVEPLGRIVVGAELVSAFRKKPETLVGPYFIVVVGGGEFPELLWACGRDNDLVAVDLSNSGLRELAGVLFECCSRLTTVAFPADLRRIGESCFRGCTALKSVDIAGTAVEEIKGMAFAGSGVVRVSLPVTLRQLDISAFRGTPLAILDLSVCANVWVVGRGTPALVGCDGPGASAEGILRIG